MTLTIAWHSENRVDPRTPSAVACGGWLFNGMLECICPNALVPMPNNSKSSFILHLQHGRLCIAARLDSAWIHLGK